MLYSKTEINEIIGRLLQQDPSLTELDFSQTFLTGDTLKEIVNAIIKHGKIEKINFSNCGMGIFDTDANEIATLINDCNKLKSIDISHCKIDTKRFRVIMQALKKNKTIQTFNINNNKMSKVKMANDILNIFIDDQETGERNTTLIDFQYDEEKIMKYFSWSRTTIAERLGENRRQFDQTTITNPSTHSFSSNFSTAPLSEGILSFPVMSSSPQKTATVDQFTSTNNEQDEFKKIARDPSLQELVYSDTALDGNTLEKICNAAIKNPFITKIIFSNCQIGSNESDREKQIQSIKKVIQNAKSLRELDLSNNYINNKFFKSIAEALASNTNIKIFRMIDNKKNHSYMINYVLNIFRQEKTGTLLNQTLIEFKTDYTISDRDLKKQVNGFLMANRQKAQTNSTPTALQFTSFTSKTDEEKHSFEQDYCAEQDPFSTYYIDNTSIDPSYIQPIEEDFFQNIPEQEIPLNEAELILPPSNNHEEDEKTIEKFSNKIKKLHQSKNLNDKIKSIMQINIKPAINKLINNRACSLMIDSTLIIAEKFSDNLLLSCAHYILACYYNRYETFIWMENDQKKPPEKLLELLAKLIKLDDKEITLENILESKNFNESIISELGNYLDTFTLEIFDFNPYYNNHTSKKYGYKLTEEQFVQKKQAYVHEDLFKLLDTTQQPSKLKGLPTDVTIFCILICVPKFREKLIAFVSNHHKRKADNLDDSRETKRTKQEAPATSSPRDVMFKPSPVISTLKSSQTLLCEEKLDDLDVIPSH